MKKRVALILGITGQDGSYLAELLLKKNYTVYGLVRRTSTSNTQRIEHLISLDNKSLEYLNNKKIIREYGDLENSGQLQNLINKIKPNEIYNLAAQSHVRVSFDMPEYTYNVVGVGTLRVLEAIRNTGLKIKFVQASSSEMFGNSLHFPQDENTAFNPESPYASAKVLGYWTAKNYRDNYKIFASNCIMFNHESPRRGLNFVTRKIVRGLCEIKLKKRKIIYLGNLEAKRDWGYAKEYCEGLWKILQQNKPGDFVLATGKSYSVRNFVEITAKQLGFEIIWKGKGEKEYGFDKKTKKTLIKVDRDFYRPTDVNYLQGSYKKAYQILNWKPKTNLQQLIKIMIKNDINLIKKDRLY
jgi:GDPmannose 4,6-dehydratase